MVVERRLSACQHLTGSEQVERLGRRIISPGGEIQALGAVFRSPSEVAMVQIKKRARRHRPKPPPASYSAPIAILALGMLGGYATMVLAPATGLTGLPLWQVALGATVITLVAAAWSLRNCLPFAKTPLRGRLVAAFCLIGCLATSVFTQQMHSYETAPAPAAPASDATDMDADEPQNLQHG